MNKLEIVAGLIEICVGIFFTHNCYEGSEVLFMFGGYHIGKRII